MSPRRVRGHAGKVGAIALLGSAASMGVSGAQSPGASPAATPLDPAAIRLVGRVVGSNAGMWRELPRTDHASTVTMDVTLTLTPGRAFVEGTALISGSYSGDCQFSHEESVAILSDSSDPSLGPPPDPTSARPAFALLGVYTSDPRLADLPPEGFFLGAGAGTGTQGGTCGHLTGRTYPIEEVEDPLSIDVSSCDLDIINLGDAYTGACSDVTGANAMSREWTASFQEVLP